MRKLVKSWKGQRKVFSLHQWERICEVIPGLKGRVYADLEVGGERITLRVAYCGNSVVVWTE